MTCLTQFRKIPEFGFLRKKRDHRAAKIFIRKKSSRIREKSMS
jgi:hypothetical protein